MDGFRQGQQRKSRGRVRVVIVALIVSMAASGCVLVGPDPDWPAGLETSGPFTVESVQVTPEALEGQQPGFAGGTVYFPSDAPTQVASVVVLPGFSVQQETVAWLGPFLASHGFAVFTLNTRSVFDYPQSRGAQAVAARTWLTAQNGEPDSFLFELLDVERYAYAGHSMGGGGALYAASQDSGTDAVLPMAPWSDNSDFSDLNMPALVVTCSGDDVAGSDGENAIHSTPIYESLLGEKARAKFEGEHSCPTTSEPRTALIGRYLVTFLKHGAYNDYRYTNFLCQPSQVEQANPETDAVEFSSTIC